MRFVQVFDFLGNSFAVNDWCCKGCIGEGVKFRIWHALHSLIRIEKYILIIGTMRKFSTTLLPTRRILGGELFNEYR